MRENFAHGANYWLVERVHSMAFKSVSIHSIPMLSYYLHNLDPFALRFGGDFGVRWYGLAYALGFLAGYLLLLRLSSRGFSQLTHDQTGDFITWGAILGVFVGGRLGYAVFYDPSLFLTPLDLFKVWKGGMASHGGILGLIIVTFWYSRRNKISWFNLGDNLVTVAPLGLFFGRCANFINGELYGRPAAVPWAVQFPGELLGRDDAWDVLDRVQQSSPGIATVGQLVERGASDPAAAAILREVLEPRHPSQIYEACFEGLFLFILLWMVRTCWPFHRENPKMARPPAGFITGLFFILYAFARIGCEQFREPDASLIGPLTRGQFYSLFMIVIGAIFIKLSLSKRPGQDQMVKNS